MNAERTRLYLLDVEGTVAPLTLTSEVLFPYARAHFAEFLRKHELDTVVRADLAQLSKENLADVEAPQSSDGSIDSALDYLLWLMDRDRKSTALKSLQGRIWKSGFESGELKGALFADVPAAFARWSQAGRIAIYSSGSVEAQQLLFRYSNFGDLTSLISGYFDTRTGPKRASASYATIAAALGAAPDELLFFSDVVEELDAARAAGCGTQLVVRPGNLPVENPNGHERIESLENI